MIISRTPFRISFFGGGTDYPAWYRTHGGAVLGATINKYCYITCRYLPPFFEHRLRVVYSHIENCQEVSEIKHPAVREVLRHLRIDRGVEIHHDGDLPARGGLGTSSAFTVGLLNALYALKGHMASKQQLAAESIRLEQDVMRETVGSQDQALAAYGGLNHITFGVNDEFTVRPLTLSRERVQALNDHVMLFFTGILRTASGIADTYVNNLQQNAERMHAISRMVEEGMGILQDGGDLDRFGMLLHEAWQAKRALGSKISNEQVEEMYSEARVAGALGGKLTGAGGGGFLLLFVPPRHQERVRERLHKMIHVPVRIEFSGSQIVFFEPEEEYLAEERRRALFEAPIFKEISALGLGLE